MMMERRRLLPSSPLFLLLLVVALLVGLLQTGSAFLVPGTSLSPSLSRSGRGALGQQQQPQLPQRGLVVALAKGKGSKRGGSKGRSSSTNNKGGFGSSSQSAPPALAQEPQQQASTGQSEGRAQEDEAGGGGYSILGSAEPPAPRGGGKGFAKAATAAEVDEAYERALSKIKGEPSKAKKPVFGAGPPGAEGKVPVRNIDLFDIMPQPLQNGIELTLIAALAVNLLVIIGLGIGFSVQAIPTSNLDLPAGVMAAATAIRPVVEKWEYLFSPALVSFFVASSLLGAFKLGQLGKGGTTYREK